MWPIATTVDILDIVIGDATSSTICFLRCNNISHALVGSTTTVEIIKEIPSTSVVNSFADLHIYSKLSVVGMANSATPKSELLAAKADGSIMILYSE